MARAGSRPYWIAYADDFGDFDVVKIHNVNEERDYRKVIARSYSKAVVKRAAKAATRRAMLDLPNPPAWIPARAIQVVRNRAGRAVKLRIKR